MYNSFLFNTTLYGSLSNSQGGGGGGLVFDVIAFNNYNFSDIIISNIPNDYEGIKFDIQSYELSGNGEGLGNRLIKNKSLTIKGRIMTETQEQLEEKITKIKANLLQGQSVLYLKRKSLILQTKAVVSQISIPRESWTINSVQIDITFSILDPFMYSVEKHELAYYGINGNFYTSIFYETGSYSAKPVIFIMFGNGTNISRVDITIGEKLVRINESFGIGDIISLDGEKLDVAKNGSYGIDRVGEFGELGFGENPVSIEIIGTANYSVFIQYRDTYV